MKFYLVPPGTTVKEPPVHKGDRSVVHLGYGYMALLKGKLPKGNDTLQEVTNLEDVAKAIVADTEYEMLDRHVKAVYDHITEQS